MTTTLYLTGATPSFGPTTRRSTATISAGFYLTNTDGGGQDDGTNWYPCVMDSNYDTADKSAIKNLSYTKGSTYYGWCKMFVSPPLAGNQSISNTGTFTVSANYEEPFTTTDMVPRLLIYVMNGSDRSVRGTLFAEANSGTEANTTIGSQQTFYNAQPVSNTVAALDGDYIVAEFLFYEAPTVSKTTVQHGFGFGGASAGYRSYLQFSQTLAFKRGIRVGTPADFTAQGITTGDSNSGAVQRFKKKFVMTFKNTTAGASRGRQSISITAPVSGWPKLVKAAGVIVQALAETLHITSASRASFKKKLQQGFSAVASVSRHNYWKKLSQGISATTSITRRLFWKRIAGAIRVAASVSQKSYFRTKVSQAIRVTDSLAKKLGRRMSQEVRVSLAPAIKGTFKKGLTQGFTTVASVGKSHVRRLSLSLVIVAGERARFHRILVQGIRAIAAASTAKTGVLTKQVVQSIETAFTLRKSQVRRTVLQLTVSSRIIKGLRRTIPQGVNAVAQVMHRLSIIRKFSDGFKLDATFSFAGKYYRVVGQALEVTDKFVSNVPQVLQLMEQVIVKDFAQKMHHLVLVSSIRISHYLLEVVRIQLSEGIILTCEMTKAFGKRIADGFVAGITLSLSTAPSILITQAITVAANTCRLFTGAIRLVQNVSATETFNRVHDTLRQLVEQLKLLMNVEALTPPFIEVEAGWLGSFPRPTTAASIIIEVNKYIEEVASPMAGLTVTANVYNARTGTLWKTLSLPETTIPGIYRSTYFGITRYDPLGTYPIVAIARRGFLTRATIDGYMVVYAGTPRSISFH